MRSVGNQQGLTLMEVLVTMSIVAVLASVAMPLTKFTGKRTQELELKQKLREMRNAIDEFRRDWARDGNLLVGPLCLKEKLVCKEITGVTGYPKKLETLLSVELSSAEAVLSETKAVRRYLRRIPVDPMTGRNDWRLRCYQDPPETQSWCNEDVFDVGSKSPEQALDHSYYREW
jgi:general secretion pathway protein G